MARQVSARSGRRCKPGKLRQLTFEAVRRGCLHSLPAAFLYCQSTRSWGAGQPTSPRSVVFHLIVSLVLVASGCTSNTTSTLQAEDVLAMNSEARNRPYVLGLGDTVTVKFLYNNELNDEVTIRPDGKISLSMLGDLTAAGLSPVELDSVLTDLYRQSLSIIGQGNEMSIRVAGTGAFDSTAVVSEKGMISLQGVGDIQVEGLSVAKLEALLAERYSDFVESPKVVVTPKSTKMVEITVGVKRSAGAS